MAIRRIDDGSEFDTEYPRVRSWLIQALSYTTDFDLKFVFSELIERRFVLWTNTNSACVAQLCELDGVQFCNLVIVCGAEGRALREIMGDGQSALVEWAKSHGCTQIRGTPRKEWTAILQRDGFKKYDETIFYKDI